MPSAPARIRAAAVRTVLEVGQGRALDQALAHTAAGITGSGRALLQELAFGVVRWRRRLDDEFLRGLTHPGRTVDDAVKALVMVGLYQLRFLNIAPHAVLSETVAAADCLGRSWAKPFVNALLRRCTREPRIIPDGTAGVRTSHPDWLVDALVRDWPEHHEEILRANNEIAPLALRVNLRRATADACVAKLVAAGIEGQRVPSLSQALLLTPRPVRDIPGFAEGEVSVQDAAAQWVPTLLAPQPGERVLDACAAPGGKAAHLLEHTPGLRLVAVDLKDARIALLESTFSRLGLNDVHIVKGDAAMPKAWWDNTAFDRILVDAPCSGTGVIRRHPDIKWLRTPEDIPRLRATQLALLSALWPLLPPGGTLLYVTCSVLRAENEVVVGEFLEHTADAYEESFTLPVGHRCRTGWQILPGEQRMDGFYYARLRKAG